MAVRLGGAVSACAGSPATPGRSADRVQLPELNVASEDAATCWFDELAAGDRESWAMPCGHGSYQGLELELLDPADEDQLMLLLEARHPEQWPRCALYRCCGCWRRLIASAPKINPPIRK